MPFAQDVWHVVAGGRSYQGAEGWSMGFWMGQPAADAGIPTSVYATDIHERLATFFGHIDTQISWAFVLDTVKIQHWSAEGPMLVNNTVFSQNVPAQVGGEQRNQIPQAALAVSFRGEVPRGPGANGRMYIPGFVNIPTSSGHIEQVEINGVLANAKAMFDGIHTDLASTGNRLILASKGGVTPPSPPVNVTATHIRIGDVTDTIDRRRNGLRENYSLSALAA